jgi:AcrR family transcriptional regulator
MFFWSLNMVRKPSPEKRAKFLESALMLFVINGVQNTSTAAIAKEAGTASGTLFLYFPTKQDLVHELILDIGREQSEYIKGLLAPSLSVRDTFWVIWNGSISWFLTHMEAYLYVKQVRDSGMIQEEIVKESEMFFDYYFSAIQKGLEHGDIKPYPLDLIGSMLYQGIVAVMNLILGNPDEEMQTNYIQTGFDIFWNGIKSEG